MGHDMQQQDKSMRARVAGKMAVRDHTIWSLNIGDRDLRLRCLRVEDTGFGSYG